MEILRSKRSTVRPRITGRLAKRPSRAMPVTMRSLRADALVRSITSAGSPSSISIEARSRGRRRGRPPVPHEFAALRCSQHPRVHATRAAGVGRTSDSIR